MEAPRLQAMVVETVAVTEVETVAVTEIEAETVVVHADVNVC